MLGREGRNGYIHVVGETKGRGRHRDVPAVFAHLPSQPSPVQGFHIHGLNLQSSRAIQFSCFRLEGGREREREREREMLNLKYR